LKWPIPFRELGALPARVLREVTQEVIEPQIPEREHRKTLSARSSTCLLDDQPARRVDGLSPFRLIGHGDWTMARQRDSSGGGRWAKQPLSPKDPTEAAQHLDQEIGRLITTHGLKTEVERQCKGIENLRTSLRHVVHDHDSETLNGLIVTGAGGMAKTRLVRGVMNEALNENHQVTWEEHHNIDHHDMVALLKRNAGPHDIVVFDDVDRMFEDAATLEILKAAQETEKERMVSYRPKRNKEDPFPDKQEFLFAGKVIVITNDSVERMKEKKPKLGPHIDAITTRMPVVDLGINTQRERLACLFRHIREGFFDHTGLGAGEIVQLARWLGAHADRIELNLRTLKRMGELVQKHPADWHNIGLALHRRRAPKLLASLEKHRNARERKNSIKPAT
jgi:hypothetical protein